MAREKAQAVQAGADDIVLCADTTVALGRRILGKPEDAGEAAAFLHALSGRRHRVITAVAVRRGDKVWERDVVTAVQMKRLSNDEVNAYLATDDWQGKAGGYGIQGPAGAFIPGFRAPSPLLSACHWPRLPTCCTPQATRFTRSAHEGPSDRLGPPQRARGRGADGRWPPA